jgi:hypothetical protein
VVVLNEDFGSVEVVCICLSIDRVGLKCPCRGRVDVFIVVVLNAGN